MTFIKTVLAAAALAVAAGGAQAARLQLVSASTTGSYQTTLASVGGASQSLTGSIDDLSGVSEVLAFGGDVGSAALAGSSTTASLEWVRMATLDASAAVTSFQATGSSVLTVDGADELADATESASVGYDAELLVASDGEAAGTAVTVRLQLVAESLFSSTIAGGADTPTFNLLVQDAAFNTLASYNGVALNDNDALDVSFSSAVGQTLSFSLSYANALNVGTAASFGPHIIESSALLDGTMTVTAVPEPQTVALLLAGLGLVGAVARRRR